MAKGKTFVSANLAYIYAISGKKTLVLGADLRKPALSKVISQKNSRGLSSYLAGLCEYEDLGEQVITENLYVIHSGHVPPNPSELLVNTRMPVLMERIMKDYDVVIIDSPPIGIVSDSIELAKYSQINIIIVRQGTTKKGSLDVINTMYLEGKLPNPAVAFNDIDFSRTIYGHKYGYSGKQGYVGYGYGYGHGYGYYDDEKPKKRGFYSKFKDRFKSKA
ncbi:MAG: CpsD/CapB family tyrosine-protein kinase [Cyclobacteriaceae bacterium]|nr:CpsD/CapB family tyrosine-protein kinase [Cyclobacteriaceae bacterium]